MTRVRARPADRGAGGLGTCRFTARGARPADGGAGTVTAVGLLALSLLLATLLVPAVAVAPARHRAAAAADAAALAAADTLVGLQPGDPCAAAARLAAAHGADLRACVPEGLIVTVEAVVGTAFCSVAMAATAGPPP